MILPPHTTPIEQKGGKRSLRRLRLPCYVVEEEQWNVNLCRLSCGGHGLDACDVRMGVVVVAVGAKPLDFVTDTPAMHWDVQ